MISYLFVWQELDGDGLIDHSEPDSADFGKKKRKTVSRQPTKPKQSNRKNITSDQVKKRKKEIMTSFSTNKIIVVNHM